MHSSNREFSLSKSAVPFLVDSHHRLIPMCEFAGRVVKLERHCEAYGSSTRLAASLDPSCGFKAPLLNGSKYDLGLV